MVRWPVIFIWTCGPCNCVATLPPPPPGRVTPYNGLYGEAPTEQGTFFSLQVNEMVGIWLVEVYEWVGKYITLVGKKAQKGQQVHFKEVKKLRKRSGFVIYLYFKDNAFTVVERDAKF